MTHAKPRNTGIDDGLRFATGFLFLVTLAVAALSVGRLHTVFNVPTPLRGVVDVHVPVPIEDLPL